MRTFESGWQNAERIAFYVRGWEPDKTPKAVVVLLHGLGEHAGRYAPVGEGLAAASYAAVGLDLRGHGRSGGRRGHTPTYERLLDDLADFLAQIEARYPGRPVFLYGHSLGGNLAINYVLRRKSMLHGVIATAPWLRLAYMPPVWRVVLARALNPFVPGFTQKSGLEVAALSRDAKIAEAYIHDPLVHDSISVRLYVAMYESGLWALEHAEEFPLPLLLMHGTADRLTSFEASREFAERGGRKVTWRPWNGYYHELHNEPQRAEVLKAMVQWMDDRLREA